MTLADDILMFLRAPRCKLTPDSPVFLGTQQFGEIDLSLSVQEMLKLLEAAGTTRQYHYVAYGVNKPRIVLVKKAGV